MKSGDKYKCSYTTGGGTEYPEGEWVIKSLTAKQVIVEKITDGGVFENYEKGYILRCSPKGGNPVRFWGDGSFTVYPQQVGTPYHFERAGDAG